MIYTCLRLFLYLNVRDKRSRKKDVSYQQDHRSISVRMDICEVKLRGSLHLDCNKTLKSNMFIYTLINNYFIIYTYILKKSI